MVSLTWQLTIFIIRRKQTVVIMQVKIAQYGILHDHARGKTRVMKESPDVDMVGIYEPDILAKQKCEHEGLFGDIHWFSSPLDILEDKSLYIATTPSAHLRSAHPSVTTMSDNITKLLL